MIQRRENRDFTVYYTEEHFSRFALENIDDSRIRVFKIHGSVHDFSSIRTTMGLIASKILSNQRMNIIRYLFSTGKHKKVLIIGYSCSDVFDITPQIQSITENKKELIFIKHYEDKTGTKEPISKEIENPFTTFPQKRIFCDTNLFIKELWYSLSETIGSYNFISSKFNWKKYVNDWALNIKEETKYYMATLILESISDFKRAIKFIQKAIELSTEIKDKARFYTCLGVIYKNLGDFNRAIENHLKSLEIAKKIGDKEGEGITQTNLGNTFKNSGDYFRAIDCHYRSLKIAKEINDLEGEACSYRNLGNIFFHFGNPERTAEFNKKALEIAKTLGNKPLEARCYATFGLCYTSSRKFEKAIDCIEASLKILKAMGNIAEQASCYSALGRIYWRLGNHNLAIENHNNALEIARTVSNRAMEATSLNNLGVVYFGLRNFKEAIDYYLNSLKLRKNTIGKEGRGISYIGLGCIYTSLGDFKRAIKYYLLAEKIFTETGQINHLRLVYYNLVLVHEKKEENEKAEYYRRKLD